MDKKINQDVNVDRDANVEVTDEISEPTYKVDTLVPTLVTIAVVLLGLCIGARTYNNTGNTSILFMIVGMFSFAAPFVGLLMLKYPKWWGGVIEVKDN